MTTHKALYIHGSGGIPAYNAVNERMLIAAILGGDAFTMPTAGIGPIGRGHGGLTPDAFLVSAGGAQNVSIAAGLALIRGTSTSPANQIGSYLSRNDAAVVVAVTNRHATLTRHDLVVAQVRDTAQTGFVNNDVVISVIAGTPAASPLDPAVTDSTLVLARLVIPPGAAGFTVTAGMINNAIRPEARCVGGLTPLPNHTTFPNPQPFDFVINTTTQALHMYDGSAWIQVGSNLTAGWTAFTPGFDGSFTVGNGSVYGRYTRLGRTVLGVLGFTRGTTSTMLGNLRVSIAGSSLPACFNPGVSGHAYMAGGRCVDASPAAHYSVSADVNPATQMFENFATLGATVWSPTNPITWATSDLFHVFFNYESAT